MDKDLLDTWVKTYGEYFSTEIDGEVFYYRALTLEEINIIQATTAGLTAADVEDEYVLTAVLHPKDLDLDDLLAGDVTQLSHMIMDASGLSSADFIIQNLNESRQNFDAGDLVGMMKAFVLTAMPAYKEDELDKFTLKELIYKVIMAEKIFSLTQAVHGIQSTGVVFEILREEDQEEEQPKRKRRRKTESQMTPEERRAMLKKIREEDFEMGDGSARHVDYSQAQNFDEELLWKASGQVDPDDPIARKLRQAMGG